MLIMSSQAYHTGVLSQGILDQELQLVQNVFGKDRAEHGQTALNDRDEQHQQKRAAPRIPNQAIGIKESAQKLSHTLKFLFFRRHSLLSPFLQQKIGLRLFDTILLYYDFRSMSSACFAGASDPPNTRS